MHVSIYTHTRTYTCLHGVWLPCWDHIVSAERRVPPACWLLNGWSRVGIHTGSCNSAQAPWLTSVGPVSHTRPEEHTDDTMRSQLKHIRTNTGVPCPQFCWTLSLHHNTVCTVYMRSWFFFQVGNSLNSCRTCGHHSVVLWLKPLRVRVMVEKMRCFTTKEQTFRL